MPPRAPAGRCSRHRHSGGPAHDSGHPTRDPAAPAPTDPTPPTPAPARCRSARPESTGPFPHPAHSAGHLLSPFSSSHPGQRPPPTDTPHPPVPSRRVTPRPKTRPRGPGVPPAAAPTVHLRYWLAEGTPRTGDMSAPDRGVGHDG
jgi:hypothetical protein